MNLVRTSPRAPTSRCTAGTKSTPTGEDNRDSVPASRTCSTWCRTPGRTARGSPRSHNTTGLTPPVSMRRVGTGCCRTPARRRVCGRSSPDRPAPVFASATPAHSLSAPTTVCLHPERGCRIETGHEYVRAPCLCAKLATAKTKRAVAPQHHRPIINQHSPISNSRLLDLLGPSISGSPARTRPLPGRSRARRAAVSILSAPPRPRGR